MCPYMRDRGADELPICEFKNEICTLCVCGNSKIYSEIQHEKMEKRKHEKDSCICFNGSPGTLLTQIKEFKPWYQKEVIPSYRTHILGRFMKTE